MKSLSYVVFTSPISAARFKTFVSVLKQSAVRKNRNIVLQFAREIIRFVSFFFVSVSRLFETFDLSCPLIWGRMETMARDSYTPP